MTEIDKLVSPVDHRTFPIGLLRETVTGVPLQKILFDVVITGVASGNMEIVSYTVSAQLVPTSFINQYICVAGGLTNIVFVVSPVLHNTLPIGLMRR